MSIPYGVMLMAIYLLLIPVADPSAPLPLTLLWSLVAVLAVQMIIYYFIRRKTYINLCVGFAQTSEKARLSMGEHLRTFSMGFYSKRDAGDLSTVLLRDYTEVENLTSGFVPQVSVILVRLTLSIIVFVVIDWRMMLALICVIPLALPFAFMSYKHMGTVSAKLMRAQQDAASRMLEYVGGIQTLKAFSQTGEHFAGAGNRSDSDKSTITRLAARFWDVDSGKVTFGGVSVTNMKTDTLLSNISMVFQDVYLFHDTIAENIRMGKAATMEEIMAVAKQAACHDFITAMTDGYDTVVGEGGSTLSGGEKQRISIARALLKDAPVVLLDEATSSLDPENEVLIQQAISTLVANKTVIVIAHRLQSVYNADRIVVLEKGRVAELPAARRC